MGKTLKIQIQKLLFLLFSFLIIDSFNSLSASFEEGLAAYEGGDYIDAFDNWIPLAKQGEAAAQRNIAHLYAAGKGVRRNLKQAELWYLKAANRGYSDAQYDLGILYLNGAPGIFADKSKAEYWLSRAAESDHALAKAELEKMSDGAVSDEEEDAQIAMEEGEDEADQIPVMEGMPKEMAAEDMSAIKPAAGENAGVSKENGGEDMALQVQNLEDVDYNRPYDEIQDLYYTFNDRHSINLENPGNEKREAPRYEVVDVEDKIDRYQPPKRSAFMDRYFPEEEESGDMLASHEAGDEVLNPVRFSAIKPAAGGGEDVSFVEPSEPEDVIVPMQDQQREILFAKGDKVSQNENEEGVSKKKLHLASYKNQKNLDKGWAQLVKQYPELRSLKSSYEYTFVPKKGAFFRLYAEGADRELSSACSHIKAEGGYCDMVDNKK